MSSARAIQNRLAGGSALDARGFSFGVTRPYAPGRIDRSSGGLPGMPLDPTWNSDRAIKEGLKVCSTLATCQGRLATKGASVPWYEWERTKGGSPKQLDIVPWIEWPRQDGAISRAQMMETALLHDGVSGNALFGILWEGGARKLRPRELQVENPHGCRPIPHRIKYISAYEWDDAALYGINNWPAEDVVHVIGRVDPSNPYWGWSIMEALAYTIDSDREARKMSLRRHRGGGRPGTIIVDKAVRSNEDLEETEESLNRRAQRRAGGFMVLGGDQDVSSQGAMTSRELELVEVMAFYRNEIAVACDFLPSIFDPSAATDNNVDHALRHEWRVAVLRLSKFADAFTKKLIPKEDRGKRWYAPYYGDVEELQDLEQKIKNTGDMVTTCQIAVDDAIAASGLPVKKQQVSVALVQGNLIPATDAAQSLGQK